MNNTTRLAHLLSMEQLSRSLIHALLAQAHQFQQARLSGKTFADRPSGKTIAHLFFEPSTRTCNSFQMAALRLNVPTLIPSLASSSLQKGETILDMVNNLAAMGVNLFIIRHGENHGLSRLAEGLKYPCHLVNAGEGTAQHPSQALIDLFTIAQHKLDWEKLSVAIVGDLYHSRVAHSLVDGLTIMGTRDIRLICPESLKPETSLTHKAQVFNTLRQGLEEADVVVCLRLQRERILQDRLIDENEFFKTFTLTTENIKYAKPDAIILHPGPINRNLEISDALVESSQSVILQQVENSVAMRMAILKLFL